MRGNRHSTTACNPPPPQDAAALLWADAAPNRRRRAPSPTEKATASLMKDWWGKRETQPGCEIKSRSIRSGCAWPLVWKIVSQSAVRFDVVPNAIIWLADPLVSARSTHHASSNTLKMSHSLFLWKKPMHCYSWTLAMYKFWEFKWCCLIDSMERSKQNWGPIAGNYKFNAWTIGKEVSENQTDHSSITNNEDEETIK